METAVRWWLKAEGAPKGPRKEWKQLHSFHFGRPNKHYG